MDTRLVVIAAPIISSSIMGFIQYWSFSNSTNSTFNSLSFLSVNDTFQYLNSLLLTIIKL
jgi:hypothetical protein